MAGELIGSPQKRRNHEAVIRRLETALAQGPYVMGDRFTGADFLISSALVFGRHAFPANDIFDSYIDRCGTRPAAVRGLALDNEAGLQTAA